MSSGRVLGVDLGSKRIGLALSDPGRIIASPLSVLRRGRSHAADHGAILAIAQEHEAALVVVGLPRTLSGTQGAAARAVLAEVDELRTAARARGVEVDVYDERLTTVVAQRALTEGGVSARAQRDVVDKVAAAVMLEGWLVSRT